MDLVLNNCTGTGTWPGSRMEVEYAEDVGVGSGGGAGGESRVPVADFELGRAPIVQEDCWAVISSYFEENGLVKQQLDSFTDFVENTVQSVVHDLGNLDIEPQNQYNIGIRSATDQGKDESECKYNVRFGQIYITNPITEGGPNMSETVPLFPREARLRNLTYATPLYVDVTKTKYGTT